MQSIRLLVIVFCGTLILCGILLTVGCNDSSSGGDNVSYNLDCTFPNVQSSVGCNTLSSANFCLNPSTYDPNSKNCYTYACLYCSK